MTDAAPETTPPTDARVEAPVAADAAAPTAAIPPAQRFDLAALRRLLGISFKDVNGKQRLQIDLGRLAFIIVIPVFCWVFYTTSSGMVDIMRKDSDDIIGLIGAFIGTSAVLIMLASTSWSLGADLGALIARRQFLGQRIAVKTGITAFVFVFVFSISAFFSFTYYYNNIFRLSSKKLVGEMQPMELAADVLLPTSKAIDESYEAETQRILAAPQIRAYLEALDALIDTGANAGPALNEAMRRTQDAASRAAALAAERTAANMREAQAANQQLAQAQERLDALEKSIATLDPIIKAKQDEIAEFTGTARQEDQLAIDASKGLDNLGASCGPNCESHRQKAIAARRRVVALRETLTGPTGERASAGKQRDALAAQIVKLRQESTNALSKQVEPAPKTELPTTDISATVHELTQARNEFRANPLSSKAQQAKAYCVLLLAAERQLNALPAAVPPDFNCEPSGDEARDLLAKRDETIAARAGYEQKCALEGSLRDAIGAISARIRNAPESDKTAAATGFNDSKALVDACVFSAKSAGLREIDVQAMLKRSDTYLRMHSMERNRFELAREAFTSLTPDATMAIGVAVAQDAFMLVMKLLSEILKREVKAREHAPMPQPMDLADNPAEDGFTRVMKALLRSAKPLHGSMSMFDTNTAAVSSLPDHVRDNLIGLLNRLVRQGIAHVDAKGVYVLDDRTLIETESRLQNALSRRRAATPTMGFWSRSDSGRRALGQPTHGYSGEEASAWRPRRGQSALERYLSPKFFPTPVASAEAGEGHAANQDA